MIITGNDSEQLMLDNFDKLLKQILETDLLAFKEAIIIKNGLTVNSIEFS